MVVFTQLSDTVVKNRTGIAGPFAANVHVCGRVYSKCLCLWHSSQQSERHCVTDGWTTSWPDTRLMPDASPLPPTSVGCDVMHGSLGGNRTAAQDGLLSHYYQRVTYVSPDIHRSSRRIWTVAFVHYQLRAPLSVGCAVLHLRRAGHTVSSLLSDLETRLWPAQACSSL